MLIFGASVGDWKEKTDYALDKADNDLAEIREIRCEGIEDVRTAFAFMAALAADTKCKEFIYHATINLYRGERMTPDQWMQSINELEKNLGLEGHYRIALEHIKKDRQHYHLFWLRLPPVGKGGPAVNMGNNYYIHDATAIALEKKFGLKPAPRHQKNKPSHKNEEIKNRNSKIRVNPDIVTKDVTRIYHASKTTKDFIRNLAKEGYTLTRSKKNKLVLVDKKGGYHGLLRRMEGVRQKDVFSKFPDLEKMALPSLSSVLRGHKPASAKSFRKAAYSFSRTRSFSSRTHSFKTRARTSHAPSLKSYSKGHNPYLTTSRTRNLVSMMSAVRARYIPKPERKYYPAPFMRKRRRKKDENEPVKLNPHRAEIERAETLEWAWENGRTDVLAGFGIILPPDFFEP